MPLLVKARSFLRNIFLPHREDIDLDQEVRSHLEMLTEENIRAGMPPHQAQRAAPRTAVSQGTRGFGIQGCSARSGRGLYRRAGARFYGWRDDLGRDRAAR